MGEGTLLIRRSSLGDVVLLGAVTSKVPGPVRVLTAPEYADVARRLNGVDEVVTWPKDAKPEQMVQRMPAGNVIDLQASVASVLLCILAGRPSKRIKKFSLTRRLKVWLKRRDTKNRPTVTQLYADACGVEPATAPWIRTEPREADTLALVPGARWQTKQWHPDAFATVGRAWEGRVVVLGGPGEQGLCDRVALAIPGALAIAETGFERTIEELSRSAVVVAGDTGLMHLAGACGARVVAIFGPTHPQDGFWVHRGEVVRRDVDCSPCSLTGDRSCPEGHHACMDLNVADVIAAMRRP